MTLTAPTQRERTASMLLALQKLEGQLAAQEAARREPVAIIGLGCRFPSAPDAPSFWRLLREGGDATRDVPAGRWDVDAYYDPDPEVPGAMYTRRGGFLDAIDHFDADFFGIAPREAVSLDPQQRLLLEVGWEALEHAGVAGRLAGSRTGVYVGLGTSDYAQRLRGLGPRPIDLYTATGTAHSVAAGRLSYQWGLVGPSVAVDTACSSSLVALHLACQGLRAGDCDLALVGGVNAILTPELLISLCKARMLAPDGRCKTFAAAADGFGRGEGCGMVVLKRLGAARRDGDRILALIRGSAVNQDGHSQGLTAPNGPSQQRVIRDALAAAEVEPRAVDYLEAHGTGTPLGDPIEVQALAAVLGQGRDAGRPLLIGSVKTNIGHLEAAAGIAGVIKVVLALQHREIPPSLHFHEPNPYIRWEDLPVRVVAARTAWPAGAGRRLAGVSSFGFGGTNAHAVLEEAPTEPDRAPPESTAAPPRPERPLHVLMLSARSDAALRALAGRYACWLGEHPDAALADVAFSANTGRAALEHRAAVVAADTAEARSRLAGLAAGDENPAGVRRGTARRPPRVAFLFTGQGSQYVGMGRELFETQPSFRRDLEECDRLLRPHWPVSLLDVLYPEGGAGSPLGETYYTQPALFALEYGLGRLWQSWGIRPDAVLGHSVGEYAAACLAGVFPLEDAVTLIAARARLMQALPGEGGMAAVFAGEEDVRRAVAARAPELSIAAINGPQLVVISGGRRGLDDVIGHLRSRGIETRPLDVSHAFHSALIEPMLAEFEREAGAIRFAPPQVEMISGVTGGPAGAEVARTGYWCRQARQPVRFADGIRALRERGCDAFLEIGPRPVLLGMARRCVDESECRWLPSLDPGREDWPVLLEGLAELAAHGAPVDWRGFDRGDPRQRLDLPSYPFQRRRYWVTPEVIAPPAASSAGTGAVRSHPLLGTRLHLASHPDEVVFEGHLEANGPGLPDDHRVFGTPILPASGFVEMALAAGDPSGFSGSVALDGVVFHRALALPDGEARTVQTSLSRAESGGFRFDIQSRPAHPPDDSGVLWTVHATGTVRVDEGDHEPPRDDLAALRARITEPLSVEALYDALGCRGVALGGALRAVVGLWRGDGEALARISLPAAAGDDEGYRLHPALLDACARVMGAIAPAPAETHLATGIRRLDVYRRPGGEVWGHARLRPDAAGSNLLADVRLLDEAGAVVADASGLETRGVDASLLRDAGGPGRGRFYELQWSPRPHPRVPSGALPAGTQGRAAPSRPAPLVARAATEAVPIERVAPWLILADASGLGARLAALLAGRGQPCVLVRRGSGFARQGDEEWTIDPAAPGDFRRLLGDLAGADGLSLRAIVYLWGLDAPDTDRLTTGTLLSDVVTTAGGVLHLVQALAAAGPSPAPRLWLVTRAAQPVGDTSTILQLAQAPLWGLGKAIALEHPEAWGGMVDLDPCGDQDADAAALLAQVGDPDGEDHIAWRHGGRWVARLARCRPRPGRGPLVRADGSYLITGGLGSLGLMTARWLVGRGARHLVLLGRGGASSGAARHEVAELAHRGARVAVAAVDVADEAALRGVFARLEADGPPLRGVIHAAGLPGRRAVAELDVAALAAMFAAKVAGSWNLHRLTGDLELDFFVCYSSMVALWGARRLGHYSAANHFLDVLTHHRRALGLPALCLNWGPLLGSGMFPDGEAAELARMGIAATDLGAAAGVLEEWLGPDGGPVAVVDIDWPRFLGVYQSRGRFPLFESFAAGPGGVARAMPRDRDGVLTRLREATSGERREVLAGHVQGTLGRILRMPPGQAPDRQRGFFDMGMDSLTAMELKRGLETSLAVALPPTVAFDYGTVDALVDFLLREMLGSGPPAADRRTEAGRPSGAGATTREMLGHLSDEEVETLLIQKMADL
jgi:acyl transferase domain-containing protein/acyl carrier protein